MWALPPSPGGWLPGCEPRRIAVLPLVNSGTKLFCDAIGVLPGRHLSARFRPTLTIRIFGHAGLDVIRTVGIAVLCLISLGAMVAISAGPPTPTPNVEAAPEQITIATGSSRDTLTNADKLEIGYIPIRVAVEPVMLARQASDETSPQPLTFPIPKIASRHWHHHNAKKLAAVSPDRRIKIHQPKSGKSVDRSKATNDPRPCRRTEGFAGLLRALNLSSGCET